MGTPSWAGSLSPWSPEEGTALGCAVSELARAQQASALTVRYMENAAGHYEAK